MKSSKEHYSDHCHECDLAMTRLSRDGSLIYCDGCSLPKPVPHAFLPTHTRLSEVKRFKKLQADRTT